MADISVRIIYFCGIYQRFYRNVFLRLTFLVPLHRKNVFQTHYLLKHFTHPLVLGAAALLLSSCIREEALNAECDITGVDDAWLQQKKSEGFLVGSPEIDNHSVHFSISKTASRTAVDPRFTLTPGASIYLDDGAGRTPGNGVVRDFSTPQTYTVVSEDGAWSKQYEVSFTYPQPIELCSFEHFGLDATGRYHVFYELDAETGERHSYWDSGNGGYAISGMAKRTEDYPTVSEAAGYRGNCVRLETRSTGGFGLQLRPKMPIAAGNLFIGHFAVGQAVQFPRQATAFGLQLVESKPLYFSGWYKYTAGEVFTDAENNVMPERHDTADIYAVLYECDPKDFQALDGDNVLTSDRIVSLARIDEPGEPQEWTHFREPFRPMNGKTFDEARLAQNGYAIAIVATSSRQGAYFEGAVGSVLYIDELRIEWEEVTE